MIETEIKKIDLLLDDKIEEVKNLLKRKKDQNYSLIDNDLVHLYTEMLTFSYSLKIWLLKGLSSVTNRPEEYLSIIKKQFRKMLHLVELLISTSQIEEEMANRHFDLYQRLDKAV